MRVRDLILPALLLASSVFAENPRHVLKSPAGELLGEDGKPVFLISTSVKEHVFRGNYEKNYPLFKNFPKELYGEGYAPAKFPLFQRIGFNALNFFGNTVSYRVLAPEYGEFKLETMLQEAQEFYRKYELDKLLEPSAALPMEKSWREHNELVREAAAKLPVYLDLHPGLQAKITRNRKAAAKFLSPEKIFASPDEHPVFALRFKLCDPEARELQKRLYVDQARYFYSMGVRPFVYKLYNEADYKDYSPENFRAFALDMEKRYPSVNALNKAWHTAYSSFGEIARLPGGKAKEIEFRKFLERQIADFTGELRDAIRTVDPEAEVLSQVHGGGWKQNWNNFNQYLINQHTGHISPGTGNYRSNAGIDVDATKTLGELSEDNVLTESLARTAFYRALADGKPILNTETYFDGFGDRYRAFKRAYWYEMVQGASMMNMWVWDGYWAPWVAPTVGYMLYHPKATTPESWRAIPETIAEIAQVSDFFLIRANRPKAEIAALFSYPTLRATQKDMEGFVRAVGASALRNIPTDGILEEQLAEGRQSRYRVIVALGVRNVYPETERYLRRFVETGGTLITDGNSLRLDEYGFPRKGDLLAGLKTVPGSGKLQLWEEKKVRFIDSDFFVPSESWQTLLRYGKQPLMVRKSVEKGMVIALAGTWQTTALSQLLAPVFDELRLKPMAVVKRFDSDGLSPYVNVFRGTSCGMNAWYVVNHTNRSKLVRISAEEFRNTTAVNYIGKQSYRPEGDTVTLLVPAQDHLVMATGGKAAVEKRFGAFETVTPETFRKRYDEEMKKVGVFVRPSVPVDLKEAANYGFDNQQGWKTSSAWFDAERRDLTGVPWHGQVFRYVNFDLIRFDFNDNKTCIALRSKNLPGAPEKVENIALNAKLRGVAFLHAVTHGKPGETAMIYRFTYEDGSHVDAPVTVGREIGDWRVAGNPAEVQKMCVWKSGKEGFFFHEWVNPFPSKTLKSFSILSGGGESTPIVAAASALPTRFEKEYANRIDLAKVMTETTAKKEGNGLRNGSYYFDREGYALMTPGQAPIALPKEKIDSAVLRFRVEMFPDEWGKTRIFNGYCWGTGLRGVCGADRNAKTAPDGQVNRFADAFNGAARHIKSYLVPAEMEISLKEMNRVYGKPFDAIYGIFWATGGNIAAFHDLRIEY